MAKNDHTVQSMIVAGGEAAILDANGLPIRYSKGILHDDKIIVPKPYVDISRIQGIFVNSGVIRFEENNALLNFVIQESRNRTVMSQLGKITEAVIVKRCSESEDVNYKLFCIAAGKKAHRSTARQFEAIGTGLIDTSIHHNWHYNPKDTQRDIIFVNKDDIPALMSNVTSLAGQCAGLQVKTSNEIIHYILPDVVNARYCVPIICLSVMDLSLTGREELFVVDIYSELIRRIMNNNRYINTLIEKNRDFFDGYLNTKGNFESRLHAYLKSRVFDIRDLDSAAFDEIMIIKGLLEQLVSGKLSPHDLTRESETLKSYLMSLGLWIGALGVKNNNMYVSALPA